MKKTLLLIAAAFVAVSSFAQKVTLDFTNAGEEWGMPLKADGVGETAKEFTNGTYTISVKAAGKDNYVYFNDKDGYLMIGKNGATLTMPAFDFSVGKIVVTGRTGASGKTLMNIIANDAEVSTQTTGSTGVNTYAIAASSQAAGTIYTLAVQSNHNAQITKIEVFEVGTEPEEPDTPGVEGEVTVKEALAAAEGSNVTVKAQAVAVGTKGAIVSDATGFIYYYGTPNFKVGDAVTITGPVTPYGGFNQFNGNTAIVTVGSNSAVTYPTPVAIDGAALDAWIAAPVQQYVTVSGKLTINGNYYNLNVEGAETGVASLASPATELMEGVSNGSDITVTGYAAYVSGSKYMNIIVTEVKVNTVVELQDPSNTMETAYTITEAKNIIDQSNVYDLSKEVYVKGVITEIKSLDVTQWQRAQYYIGETVDAESTILVYNGYYLEGKDFTANDQIKVGDEVIVLGSLTLYYETYEINQNNKIVSLNGLTDGINGVQLNAAEGKAYDLTGRVANKNAKGIVIINGKKFVK